MSSILVGFVGSVVDTILWGIYHLADNILYF